MKELRGYKIFIASPDDLYPMHESIKRHIHIFNLSHAIEKCVIFIPVNHEDAPGGHSDGGAQDIINKESDWDYSIIMFGKKLGTPTEKYRSGTIEEYERCKELKKAGKMENFLVLCQESISQDGMTLDELREYTETRGYIEETLYKEGNNCKPFDSDSKLIEEVNRFLAAAIKKVGIVDTVKLTVHDVKKQPSDI